MTFEEISRYFNLALPILGTAALIVLVILIIRLSNLIKRLRTTIDKVDATIDSANGTLNDAQKTVGTVNTYLGEMKTAVNTIVNVSMSVEAVRATASGLVKKGMEQWRKGYDTAKDVMTKMIKKDGE